MAHFIYLADSSLPVKIVFILLFMFIIGSFFGYVLEVFFRRFVTAKKWVNPGFMKGPYLPLYGFGVVLMFSLSFFILYYLKDKMIFYNPTGDLFNLSYRSGPTVNDLLPLSIMSASMVLLELVAGIIFVKGFKVRLWDYSNMKGNFLGVICPLFSFFWMVICVIFYYGLNPFLYKIFSDLFVFLFIDSNVSLTIISIFSLGMIYGVFLIDLITSLNLFSRIIKSVKDLAIIQKYENVREEQKKQIHSYKEKIYSQLKDSIKFKEESDEKMKTGKKKISSFIKKLILINPDINDCKDNYDENGRPIKEDK